MDRIDVVRINKYNCWGEGESDFVFRWITRSLNEHPIRFRIMSNLGE
jgi:hypothetical protein